MFDFSNKIMQNYLAVVLQRDVQDTCPLLCYVPAQLVLNFCAGSSLTTQLHA